LKCSPFLDASKTHTISRMLWVPDLPVIPAKFRRQWGDYCLLRRTSRKGA
jgi:alpha-1,2-mannosyltransferase